MPIERDGRVPNQHGQMETHDPGAYQAVLRKVCSEIAQSSQVDSILRAETPDDDADHSQRCAERTAELMRKGNGQPVRCRSYQLPGGLHAPFERFPVGGQRCFVVDPSDTITLVAREKEDTMPLSNIVPGKQNSIYQGGGGAQTVPDERPGHAPTFARPGELEPNCVVGERLQPAEARPRREPTRTLAEAREIGLSMPEALDLTPDEVTAWLGEPPESSPDQS